MKNIFTLVSLFVIISNSSFSQQGLISGPMLGPIELRDAKLWIEVAPEVKSASIQFNAKGSRKGRTILYKGELGKDFNPITFTLGGLEPNTTYQYEILVNGKSANASGEFTTK